MPESSRRADGSLARALALARDAIAAEPAGLLTDFDGTLAPIVHDPFMAGLVDGADGALAALARRLAVVAIVTGRMPLDARRVVGVPGVLIVGNHGSEWLAPGESDPTVTAGAEAIGRALDEALSRVPPMNGVVTDHKGVSASVHYRQAPDPGAARAAILEALGDLEPLGLRIGHGRMIVELSAPGRGRSDPPNGGRDGAPSRVAMRHGSNSLQGLRCGTEGHRGAAARRARHGDPF